MAEGKIPRRWTVRAVAMNMKQWMNRFSPEAHKKRLVRGDVVAVLNQTRRVREIFKNRLNKLVAEARQKWSEFVRTLS